AGFVTCWLLVEALQGDLHLLALALRLRRREVASARCLIGRLLALQAGAVGGEGGLESECQGGALRSRGWDGGPGRAVSWQAGARPGVDGPVDPAVDGGR